MILSRFIKQPAEVKDYDVDYNEWLTPSADTLSNTTTSVLCQTDPDDTSLTIDSVQTAASAIKIWVSGGTDGARYKVTVQVDTLGGRRDESELIFVVKDF